MSLAEVAAVDVDADSSPSSSSSITQLFVLCTASSSSSSKRPNGSSLRLQLLDGSSLFEAEVAASHKPRALDCSPVEYLAAVQMALSPQTRNQQTRFAFRWSRAKRTLTLMERAGFAMKFSAVEFVPVADASTWRQLLHQVAAQQAQGREERGEGEEKVEKLEKLLQQKETLLEAALAAKQKEEDRLFRGFCAVLNGKKDEIQRLRNELHRAQETQRFEVKQGGKRKVTAPKRGKKATGAKLKKMKEEEEQDEKMSEDESSREESGEESDAMEEDDDEGNERKRVKRDAISAYSQLPASVKRDSVQISSAEDLLASMDDIIKNEEEGNEATQRGDTSGQGVKVEPIARQSQPAELSKPRRTTARTRKAPVVKVEPTPPSPPKPAAEDEAMNSEEEDILDMLS
ncbi:hypothetical protein PR003_g10930 [Phytophthora rubi]|uniref:DNA repair protein XRCC4 n=1 Tax=Phytophthora rubi TaxID=129364 RepID=A0A6A3M742_9STRA|nr:hypothetical protein PR002_g10515 [Phytophthora rubi]KAE9339594.1 hypothetical protein PR003_g10930 [Phytophthora rubi]